MSLVDVDSWKTEYEACDRLSQSIRNQLTHRSKRQRASSEYNQLTSSIKVGLNQFATELKQLKEKLNASAKTNSITFEEIEVRQRHVDTLQSQLLQLKSEYNNSLPPSELERVSLLGQASGSTTTTQWQSNGGNTAPVIDTTDVNMLKQRQIDLLESQNQGLETLSRTISRQRALTSQLGQEVEEQNDILDNLANTMERVDARVNIETGNISNVNRRDSTWGYWTLIILLFIVNIVVAFVL